MRLWVGAQSVCVELLVFGPKVAVLVAGQVVAACRVMGLSILRWLAFVPRVAVSVWARVLLVGLESNLGFLVLCSEVAVLVAAAQIVAACRVMNFPILRWLACVPRVAVSVWARVLWYQVTAAPILLPHLWRAIFELRSSVHAHRLLVRISLVLASVVYLRNQRILSFEQCLEW